MDVSLEEVTNEVNVNWYWYRLIASGVQSAERVLRGLVKKSKYERHGPKRHDHTTLLTSLSLCNHGSDLQTVFFDG